jgi:hypothetical protein
VVCKAGIQDFCSISERFRSILYYRTCLGQCTLNLQPLAICGSIARRLLHHYAERVSQTPGEHNRQLQRRQHVAINSHWFQSTSAERTWRIRAAIFGSLQFHRLAFFITELRLFSILLACFASRAMNWILTLGRDWETIERRACENSFWLPQALIPETAFPITDNSGHLPIQRVHYPWNFANIAHLVGTRLSS